MNSKKGLILIFLIIVSIFAFFFLKNRSRKKETFKESEEISLPTPFPTLYRKPGAVRPTITYQKFPFNPSDKTRKFEIVGCVIDNSEWGMSYPKKIVEVPNVSALATEVMKAFLKEATQNGWGGFPTRKEVENYFGTPGEVTLKKLTIDKYGTARVYFSSEVKAYGGGSARVSCMQDSVELTLKQFPNIKRVVMCIEDVCAEQKGSIIFQP